MQPIVLSNAFRRPRATRLSSRVTLSETTNVYACVEEVVGVIRDELGATPLLLPTTFDPDSLMALLKPVDGILLPGAASNIHPQTYGAEIEPVPQTFDTDHDATDIFLARAALKMSIPFFGICRGFQAINVAMGGSLRQSLPANSIDHECSAPCEGFKDDPAFMHPLQIEEGGILASLFKEPRIQVNSLHEQALDHLGEGLRVEARAPDGLVEAISATTPHPFFLGVQWHPEALPKHAVSQALFGLFKEKIRERQKRRSA